MIEPKELRIGNYILYNDELVMVQGITANNVFINGISVAANSQNIRPIQLCDIILRNIRQSTSGHKCYTYYKTSTFMIYVDDNGNFFIGLDYQGNVCHVTIKPILYLHQLQNIHYAQYGKDMIIDKKSLLMGIDNAIGRGVI